MKTLKNTSLFIQIVLIMICNTLYGQTILDPKYSNQWYLDNNDDLAIHINALEAWQITTGSSNITIAVVDSGVEPHEDLNFIPNYLAREKRLTSPNENEGVTHGQGCAGIIGAEHNTLGVRGIAPGVTLISVDISGATKKEEADAIRWAVYDMGADVISYSQGKNPDFGSQDIWPEITEVFNEIATYGREGKGVITVVAAGNQGIHGTGLGYPANLASVIGVGAISRDGTRPSYSQYGPTLDLTAPSNNFVDGVPENVLETTDLDNKYFGMLQTSAVAPQIASVAALILSVNPQLSREKVVNIMTSTARDMGVPGRDDDFGYGLVDAKAAVQEAASDTEPPSTPTNISAINITPTSFNIHWLASVDNTGVEGYNVYLDGVFIDRTTTPTFELSELNPSTTYQIEVEAYDKFLTSPVSTFTFSTPATPQSEIQDPLYSYQWYLKNVGGNDKYGDPLAPGIDINVEQAWEITKGSANITVAIIDDGITGHEDLPNLLPGYTVGGGDGSPNASSSGHGQAIAGIINAKHNNLGIRGIAPNVKIVSVKASGSDEVADGINWAVNNGIDIISISQNFANSVLLEEAINNAATNGRNGKGTLLILSAGNFCYENCFSGLSYFPSLENVLAVGAVTGNGSKSKYSNFGAELDLVAPSDDYTPVLNGTPNDYQYLIQTIDLPGSSGYSRDQYTDFGGTSAAAPQVAAVAALVLSVNPDLTKVEVEHILTSTATDIGSIGSDDEFGYGIVNALAAVNAAVATVFYPPTNLIVYNSEPTRMEVRWEPPTQDVSGYQVFLDGQLIGSTASTLYHFEKLIPNTEYRISIRAYDNNGNLSETTNETFSTLAPDVIEQSSFDYGYDGWKSYSDAIWVDARKSRFISNYIELSNTGFIVYSAAMANLNQFDSIGVEFVFMAENMSDNDGFTFGYYRPELTFQSISSFIIGKDFSNNVTKRAEFGFSNTEIDFRNIGYFALSANSSNGKVSIDKIIIRGFNTHPIAACNTYNLSNFEDGWGTWTGGNQTRRNLQDKTWAFSGVSCAQIRNNSTESNITSENINLEEGESLNVSFTFTTNGVDESSDGFILQVSNNNGNSFSDVKDWRLNRDFENYFRYFVKDITINESFIGNVMLRFQGDVNGKSAYIYMDDIEIVKCTDTNLSVRIDQNNNAKQGEMYHLPDTDDSIGHVINLFPNPLGGERILNLSPLPQQVHTVLYNQHGQVIPHVIKNDQIDLSEQPAGIYLLQLNYEGRAYTKKVVLR